MTDHAGVVELVDTPDLGSGALGCESSSLSFRTMSVSLWSVKKYSRQCCQNIVAFADTSTLFDTSN